MVQKPTAGRGPEGNRGDPTSPTPGGTVIMGTPAAPLQTGVAGLFTCSMGSAIRKPTAGCIRPARRYIKQPATGRPRPLSAPMADGVPGRHARQPAGFGGNFRRSSKGFRCRLTPFPRVNSTVRGGSDTKTRLRKNEIFSNPNGLGNRNCFDAFALWLPK